MFLLGIGKIPYRKDAGPEETLVFKHYNAEEVQRAVFLCVNHIMSTLISSLYNYQVFFNNGLGANQGHNEYC
jgi:hypothetical protein